MKRLLAAAGLARRSEVEHERRLAADIRAAERARASRAAAAAAAKAKDLGEKLRATRDRLVAEHADTNIVVGLLRHYLVRLRRAEVELAERNAAARALRLAQLAISVKEARRRGLPADAAERAAHFATVASGYSAAVARWRSGDVPADTQRTTIARLQWAAPGDVTNEPARRIVKDGRLPLDDFAAVRDFAVGGVMLDIGAGIGATSLPRVVLGDFARVYAAEPDPSHYLYLVGNTLDNQLEGFVLPDRVAIGGAPGCLALDAWITRLGIDADAVRFVRVALQESNLDILPGAAHLLRRRRVVWQLEMSPACVTAAVDGDLCSRIAAHFSHVKELGRFWIDRWRPASDVHEVFDALSREHRGANLLLFNLRGGLGGNGSSDR